MVRGLLVVAVTLSAIAPAWAVDDCASVDDGEYVIRKSFVEGWWPLPVDLPTGRYSSAVASEAMARTNKARAERGTELEFLSAGTVAITETDTCARLVPEETCRQEVGTAHCLDLAVRVHAVRVDLLKSGDNVMPVPRFGAFTDFNVVPAPLRALNPQVGGGFDRNYGPSATWGFSSALSASSLLGNEDGKPKAPGMELDVATSGRKSLDDRFYETNNMVRLVTHRASSLVRRFTLDGTVTAEDQPLGDGHVARVLAYGGGGMSFRPPSEWLRLIAVDGRYRWGRIDRHSPEHTEERNERGGLGRVAVDAVIDRTLARLALWGEQTDPTGDRGTYSRATAFAGVGREFKVALNQTIGAELVAAVGRTWGDAPDDARFYAGNSNRNFLYDALDGASSIAMPNGPLLRNLGENRGGVRTRGQIPSGGTAFWNVSLTLSFPIPPLSRPLIPNVDVIAGTLTLKDALKTAVMRTGPSMMQATMVEQGRDPNEAQAEAESVFSKLKPTIDFIADQANLWAVKPLLLLDAAQLEASHSANDGLRLGVGGGVQLTVVVARLELAYVPSVLRERGDDSGNVLFRMTFQNLF